MLRQKKWVPRLAPKLEEMPSRMHMTLSICQSSPVYLLAHLLRNLGSSACFHVLPHEAPELGLISLVRGYPGICTFCSLLDRGETNTPTGS